MLKRYALTHIKDGVRQLTSANTGQYHYATEGKAFAKLAQFQEANASTLGDYPGLAVCAVECYDHGDAKKIYFEESDVIKW